jgi:hypothetical protein
MYRFRLQGSFALCLFDALVEISISAASANLNLCVTNYMFSTLLGISSISRKNIGPAMNTNFPDRIKSTESPRDRVFDDLRWRLAQETECRKLADLLESVNAMQRARSVSDEFDLRFEEFVYRAEDYLVAVRPFFPSLVVFLSSRGVAARMAPGSGQASEQAGAAARVA